MIVKSIVPRREFVKNEKTTVYEGDKLSVVDGYDFYRAVPVEKVEVFDDFLSALKPIAQEQNKSLLIATSENRIYESAVSAGFGCFAVRSQGAMIKELERFYAKKERPTGIVFDYNFRQVSAHAYLREIYLQQNLHVFRNLPVLIVNHDGNEEKMVETIKVLAVNGSPRKNGDTKKLLDEETARHWTGPYYESKIVNLGHIVECLACGGHQKNCKPDCFVDDQMRELLPEVKRSDVLIVGSPVYMDMPTARTLAFLSRLTGQTKFNRREYIGKYASAVSPGWCSGTKAVIGSLTNALEMMGFTIQGRSSREFVALWADQKTRGGVPNDFYWPK
jgi:multimeric flavodoxin WrbA